MPDPYAHRAVAYRALSGPPDIEIVLNESDGPPPGRIFTRDMRPAVLANTTPQPGRPPLIPSDWQPIPGKTRALVPLTEELAFDQAEQLAPALFPLTRFESEEELAAVLYQGLLNEMSRGGCAVVDLEPPTTEPSTPQEQS